MVQSDIGIVHCGAGVVVLEWCFVVRGGVIEQYVVVLDEN